MMALHGGWATTSAALARQAEVGFAAPMELVLLVAVAVLVVGFLLVFIATRRSSRDGAADTPAPPSGQRPAVPREAWRPAAPPPPPPPVPREDWRPAAPPAAP